MAFLRYHAVVGWCMERVEASDQRSAISVQKSGQRVFPSGQGNMRRQFGETFLLNDRVNQLLLENLDAKAWRAKPEGRGVRTIDAIFSHMHNVRRKWIRLSAPHLKLPAELDRARCTQKQAAAALMESARLCAAVLEDKRVTKFVRDDWAKPWDLATGTGAAAMLAYMVSHEAHHRGQVCMLAHQMGYRLPMKVMSRMWSWEGLSPHHAKGARDGGPEELARGKGKG